MRTPWKVATVGALAVGAVAAFRRYRRRHLAWGATPDEVSAPMLGDDLVPQPHFAATRAITIEAPPEAVWPWLVLSWC